MSAVLRSILRQTSGWFSFIPERCWTKCAIRCAEGRTWKGSAVESWPAEPLFKQVYAARRSARRSLTRPAAR